MPLYISEFTDFSRRTTAGNAESLGLPARASQTVDVGAASTASTAFTGYVIRVVTDTACCVVAGPNPTATATDTYLAAGVPEYFAVNPGDKLAVIAAS